MAKITTSGGKLTVAELDLQNKATKAVDGAESKIARFTRLFDRTTRKNDIPSESTIKKAEEFVSKRVGKGKKNNELPGVFSTLFMLPFLLGRGSKTNEVDPETELRQVYGGDDELMKEKLGEEKKKRDEGKEVIDKQVNEDNKVSTEKKVDVDKIKEPEQDQKEQDEKKSEVEAKKDKLDTKELEEGEKTEETEEKEREEKKREAKKTKVKKTGIDRLSELVDRFTKLVEAGTPMAGAGKKENKLLDFVKEGGIMGAVSRGIVNAFMPAASASETPTSLDVGGVKEIELTDNTTEKITETTNEIKPQEDIMGKPVKKSLEYDQDLPIEERKKIIYEMAVKAGAKFPEAVVAQYQLETTSGENNIGKNNFFNLKAVEGMDSTEAVVDEYEKDGKKYQEKANFINFKTAQDAVDYLVKLWYKDYKGYTGVETDAESADDVARNLEKEGFATDRNEKTGMPQYADKLIKVMKGNQPLIKKIKESGSLLMSSLKNIMMKDEIEPIEDYSSTDEEGMANTIVIMKAPSKRNSMLPISAPPPSAGRQGAGQGGGRVNPNDSLTMLTLQSLGGS